MMYPSYNGIKSGLNSDDIAGIRSIYSGDCRSADAYDAGGLQRHVRHGHEPELADQPDDADGAGAQPRHHHDRRTVDDYTFNAPSGTTGTLTLNVQSSGLSLLSPKVTVYAADQTTVLGSASGLNQYGTTLTVTVSGVTAGQQFYVKVQGADTTAFSTGAYALTLNFGNGASPTVPLPHDPDAQRQPDLTEVAGGRLAARPCRPRFPARAPVLRHARTQADIPTPSIGATDRPTFDGVGPTRAPFAVYSSRIPLPCEIPE